MAVPTTSQSSGTLARRPVAWPVIANQRLFKLKQAEQNVFALTPAALKTRRVVHALLHPDNVAAGKKRRAGTGEQHHIAAAIALGQTPTILNHATFLRRCHHVNAQPQRPRNPRTD